jgi:hypothetical protein
MHMTIKKAGKERDLNAEPGDEAGVAGMVLDLPTGRPKTLLPTRNKSGEKLLGRKRDCRTWKNSWNMRSRKNNLAMLIL